MTAVQSEHYFSEENLLLLKLFIFHSGSIASSEERYDVKIKMIMWMSCNLFYNFSGQVNYHF